VDYLFAPECYETPEFVLRSYQPGDGPLINEAVNNSYEHLRTFMPWAVPHTPLDESEKLVRRWRGDYLLCKDFMLGIFAPGQARQLGSTGYMLRKEPLSLGNAEIGMWIRADAAGHGLGTSVLVALLRWGFTAWPWLRLEWRCDTRNLASARTAEKAGMHKEGCLRGDFPLEDEMRRDTFIFGALRDEWLAAHPAQ
jgi:RimJ/RimL family protein N-acetyltransferase